MLIDEIDITVTGGHGGAGKMSFYPGKLSGPSGGNGGKGGDVYLKAESDLTLLNQFLAKHNLTGEQGKAGGNFRKTGEDGEDLYIKIPVGTEVTDPEMGIIFEMDHVGQEILIAKGGLGGKGNYELRSSRNTTPMNAQSGLNGQEKKLKLILKLIADFGFVGLPNSGKSSLLNHLTNANARVGAYPFTTLEPNLGVLKTPYKNYVLADIPGLIEGASGGKGLGIKFLKHIEKVSVLLHTISLDSENPLEDYKVIKEELEKFNPKLLEKKEIIILTKSDLVDESQIKEKIKVVKKLKKEIVPVSIYNYDSLESLKKRLAQSSK